MSEAFTVDAQQMRAHAARIEEIQRRFSEVRAASTAITKDDEAYGRLCGWVAGILEKRHTRQEQLFAYVEENLALAADSLTSAAADYDETDEAVADRMRRVLPTSSE